MDKKKKVERAQKGLLDLIAAMGGDVTDLKEQPLVNEHDFRTSLEAEGILLTLQSDKRTVALKECKECHEPFATNYKYVGYCTNACRALALKHIGIKWDPTKKDEQRWGTIDNPSQIPIVISNAALEQLRIIVEAMDQIQIQNGMAEAAERRRLRIQNGTETLSDKLSPLLGQVYRGEIQDQLERQLVLPQHKFVEFGGLQHSQELEPTNVDPELPVSKPQQSKVVFAPFPSR